MVSVKKETLLDLLNTNKKYFNKLVEIENYIEELLLILEDHYESTDIEWKLLIMGKSIEGVLDE